MYYCTYGNKGNDEGINPYFHTGIPKLLDPSLCNIFNTETVSRNTTHLKKSSCWSRAGNWGAGSAYLPCGSPVESAWGVGLKVGEAPAWGNITPGWEILTFGRCEAVGYNCASLGPENHAGTDDVNVDGCLYQLAWFIIAGGEDVHVKLPIGAASFGRVIPTPCPGRRVPRHTIHI